MSRFETIGPFFSVSGIQPLLMRLVTVKERLPKMLDECLEYLLERKSNEEDFTFEVRFSFIF